MNDWEIDFTKRAGVTSVNQRVRHVMKIAGKNDGVIEEVKCQRGVSHRKDIGTKLTFCQMGF